MDQVTTEYTVSLFKTRIGFKMCNEELYFNDKEIAFNCDCMRNKAGFYCDHLSMSDSEYMLRIQFLTLSNLAMVPALIYAYYYKCYVEFTGYMANMIASYIYHYCDEQYYCFELGYGALYIIDIILSFNSISMTFIFLAKFSNLKVKFSLILSVLVLLLYIELNSSIFNNFITSVMVFSN